jgi:hypothetical protein
MTGFYLFNACSNISSYIFADGQTSNFQFGDTTSAAFAQAKSAGFIYGAVDNTNLQQILSLMQAKQLPSG